MCTGIRLGITVAGLGAIATIGLSCAGGNLSNMWRDSTYTGGPLTNVLVLAIKRDPLSRRNWEDRIVEELGESGVAATRSYEQFPDDVPDTSQVDDAVEAKGFDGVITVSSLPAETTVTYVPGYVSERPVMVFDRWTQFYYTLYRTEYQPGYVDREQHVRNEINVWTTGEDGRLVWAGIGEVIDPRSAKAVRDQVVDVVLPELEEQGLIPPDKN